MLSANFIFACLLANKLARANCENKINSLEWPEVLLVHPNKPKKLHYSSLMT